MNQDFLTETVRFLKHSDLNLYPLEYRKVELTFEDDKIIKNIHLELSEVYSNKPQISNNLILQVIVIFSTLDAKIDLKFPELQGQTFKYKYDHLPCESDEDIIFKECFRVFKLLRNAATHSMTSITVTNEKILVQYNFRGTNFYLDITQMGMSLLFTYILESFSPDNRYTNNHRKAFNRELFDRINAEIPGITDEFGTGLNQISEEFRLKKSVRYYLKNPSFILLNESNKLRITTPYELKSEYEQGYSVDYLINMSEDATYLVPSEMLNEQYEITISNIIDWKI
ncbi:hypothetical protein [Viridibacillus arvi]|uniref:hypothetical protein n=1 Tax=Viridibacillus arvi TaxID=263475 RepID=UPI0034CD59BF